MEYVTDWWSSDEWKETILNGPFHRGASFTRELAGSSSQTRSPPDNMLTLGQRWQFVGFVGVGVWLAIDVEPTLAYGRHDFRWHDDDK